VEESEIQGAILDFLTLQCIFYWRNNNGPTTVTGSGGKQRLMGLPAVLTTGRSVAYSKHATMTIEEVRSRFRDQIVAAAGKRGAHNIRVFGSVARGDQQHGSDIDFLVDFEPGRSLLDLTGLWLDLEAVLGCKVDVVSSRGLKPRLASEVMRDAVAL
jgi:predicted nucleotidyltransferase